MIIVIMQIANRKWQNLSAVKSRQDRASDGVNGKVAAVAAAVQD